MTKKLHLTKRQAIKECKELWAEAERSKQDKFIVFRRLFPEKNYFNSCPLCEYSTQFVKPGSHLLAKCSVCPFITQLGYSCLSLEYTLTGSPTFFQAVRELKYRG
jgi:hypothetical protein